MTQTLAEKQEAIAQLRRYVEAGDTLYCIVRHVSRSGMMRVVAVYGIKKNEPVSLSRCIAKAIGLPYDHKRDGIRIGGCWMDAGFKIVYALGRVLFPKGFIPAKSGRTRGRNGTPATERDTDGGYALERRWL